MPISVDLSNIDITNQTPYCVLKNNDTYFDAEWNKEYTFDICSQHKIIDLEIWCKKNDTGNQSLIGTTLIDLSKDDFRQKLQYKYDLKSGGMIIGKVTLRINNMSELDYEPQK